MEEKRRDLKSLKQKEVISRIVAELNEQHPNFYYLSTSDVAFEVAAYIKEGGHLNKPDRDLVEHLEPRDIQIILSFHDDE